MDSITRIGTSRREFLKGTGQALTTSALLTALAPRIYAGEDNAIKVAHNVDECCWMKGSWPVKAQGSGGRCHRGRNVDQNFDNYNVEYTFADGTKLFLYARNIPGCHGEFASYAHGTKGSAVISTNMHTPTKCRIYKSQG